MPILVDDLSVWDISFRWASYDPRKFYYRIPLEVENNFRNLMNAVISAEIDCLTISLEKREFEKDEKEFSVYYWLDDIYACIAGASYNKKLLRFALIERSSLMLWCQRMNIPLPEFWFPMGWNLHYELPEDELYPGHWYERQNWTKEQLEAYRQIVEANALKIDSPEHQATIKMRPSQEIRIACQQIAKGIWFKEPDRTIASVVNDPLIQEYGGAKSYNDETVRDWVKAIAPDHVKNRRGRPRKNQD